MNYRYAALLLLVAIVCGGAEGISCGCNIVCTTIYQPVCATDGYIIKTFSNPCSVTAENICCGTRFSILFYGPCFYGK